MNRTSAAASSMKLITGLAGRPCDVEPTRSSDYRGVGTSAEGRLPPRQGHGGGGSEICPITEPRAATRRGPQHVDRESSV